MHTYNVQPGRQPVTYNVQPATYRHAALRRTKRTTALSSFERDEHGSSVAQELARALHCERAHLMRIHAYRAYRDAARTNGVALKARDASATDHHRRKLLEMLRAVGLNVRENVGLSKFRIDLCITSGNSSDQFLAVLLDGEEWTKRTTPFDRDLLPHSVLRLIGWRRIGRIWLKAFVDDPNHVVRIIQNEVKREKDRQRLVDDQV